MRFTAMIILEGKTATGIAVPPAAVEGARKAFDALSYSNQRRHVLAIEGAKTPETRARRIAGAVGEVAEMGGG